ncbi:amino acid permease [Streptomyces sp. NPDC049906]|uniref:amino acid permease n=1 Tax=Streptomyces sp. NPDC049906 TaxID=3155656 RepID=UPI0034364669
MTLKPLKSPSPGSGDGQDAYFARRALRRGSAGWLLLTGLGVAYVVSGDFSGWNFGLAEGGFGGLAVAMLLMGVMYACMVFSLAELSSILPTAGGGYGFARRALGPWGGFLTGTAILIEYVLAPAAISIFIGDYVESLGLFGLTSGWPVYLACFLSLTSRRKAPYLGLLVPGAVGFGLAASTGDGARMLNVAVFGATISYALMSLSHIVLRRREPGLPRPYRTPGGTATSSVALVLACAALVATFLVDVTAAVIALLVYGAALAYFGVYSKDRLVARAPEEEFAALAAAEAELR